MRESYQRQDAKARGGPDARTHRTAQPRSEPPTVPHASSTSGCRGADAAPPSWRRARSPGRLVGSPTLTLASPDNPVTWDIADDNKPIADGLAPEKGATLQLYSYADYVSPDAVKSFEDKYGVKVEISTFNDTDEAITKIRGGNVDYDIYFPSYDQISRLVNGKLLRAAEPQLHPEHQECLADLHQPLVRPGVALHRALHDLHHRHRLA